MSKVAIVILNYLNYEDTIECVESIFDMQYSICGIIIVDNASGNGSYKRLKKIYRNNDKVYLIASKKNLGFARGNNLGIDYARKKLNADFVLVANNDTLFIDKKYIRCMLQRYEPGIGVIGSKIILKGNNEQQQTVRYLDLKNVILHYLNLMSLLQGSSFDFPINEGKSTTVLHGCALLFTPDFFKAYTGFYKRTFLYGEEDILYYMCKCKNLRQVYVPETKIFHKEDQSSMMSFQNDSLTVYKYAFQSKKYLIWWMIKCNVLCFLKENFCHGEKQKSRQRDMYCKVSV